MFEKVFKKVFAIVFSKRYFLPAADVVQKKLRKKVADRHADHPVHGAYIYSTRMMMCSRRLRFYETFRVYSDDRAHVQIQYRSEGTLCAKKKH